MSQILHINFTDIAVEIFNDMLVGGVVKLAWFGPLFPHLRFSGINGHRHHSSNDMNDQQQSRDLKHCVHLSVTTLRKGGITQHKVLFWERKRLNFQLHVYNGARSHSGSPSCIEAITIGTHIHSKNF